MKARSLNDGADQETAVILFPNRGTDSPPHRRSWRPDTLSPNRHVISPRHSSRKPSLLPLIYALAPAASGEQRPACVRLPSPQAARSPRHWVRHAGAGVIDQHCRACYVQVQAKDVVVVQHVLEVRGLQTKHGEKWSEHKIT